MMLAFFSAVAFTLGVSALCSVLEAMILSTRSIEVENLKKTHPRAGLLLEKLRHDLEGTIASVLTINTVANTLGSIIVGALATKAFGDWWLGVVSGGMTLCILFFSEILPKNIGVIYRRTLHPIMVYPLYGITRLAGPMTDLSAWLIRKILRKPADSGTEGEILMLAEKETLDGRMHERQLRMIRSALELDDTTVEALMTPRNVVVSCEAEETIQELCERLGKIRFARIPVSGEDRDDIIGVIRRKDILFALAAGKTDAKVSDLMRPPVFVSEIGKLSKALEIMISGHQPLAIVVDEFGGFAGVVSLEDFFEHFIGKEFYESDDVAVDMQELARNRSLEKTKTLGNWDSQRPKS